MLTVERLRELLHYNPETGVFTYRVTRKGVSKGKVAGWHGKTDSRRRICLDGKTYLASRLAFLYMTGCWPKNEADHIDTNPTNDQWSNLRDATRVENCRNKSHYKNSKTGVKGVYFAAQKKSNQFVAEIWDPRQKASCWLFSYLRRSESRPVKQLQKNFMVHLGERNASPS